MKIVESLRQLGKVCFQPFIRSSARPDPEKFYESIRCELIRRNLAVEGYGCFGSSVIKGSINIFPLVLVNVQIDYFSGEITGCVHFTEDKYYNLIMNDEKLRGKTQKRYYNTSSDNPEEIARELNNDALLLGVALDEAIRRQDIEGGETQH